jgi:hypothetical protein
MDHWRNYLDQTRQTRRTVGKIRRTALGRVPPAGYGCAMSRTTLELRTDTAFWRWHLLGWLLYGVGMFAAAAQWLSLPEAFVNKTVNVAVGFALSLMLRAIYLRQQARGQPLHTLLPLLLLGCILGGAAWSAVSNAWFWLYRGEDPLTLRMDQWFRWTLMHVMALVAWCACYLGAVWFDELQRARAVALASRLAAEPSPPLVVRADGELLQLPQDQIHCIEAARNYSCIVSDAGTHVVRVPLTTLAARLDSREFVRVHRSAVIAVRRLQSLRPLPTQDAIATLTGGREIRVSRSFRAQVERALSRPH